jgi:fucose permease
MRSGPRSVLVIASLVFLALGLLFSQVGPALDELANRSSTTLAQVGAIFTAIFLGSLLTQSIAGPASDRIGERPVLLAGLGLAVLGMTGVGLSRSLSLLLACAFIAGTGYGFIAVGTNLLVARAFVERSVSALNLTNLFFGIGAVCGPALGSAAVHAWNTALPALWLGVALMVILFVLIYFAAAGRSVARPSRAAGADTAQPTLYRSPLLWMLSAMLFMYVGLETAVGGWTTTYLQATASYRLESAALVVSGYWLALTAGRLVNSWLGIRRSAARVLLWSLAGAAAGGCLLAPTTGRPALTIAGVLVLGFSFGAIFPTGLAIVTSTFARDAGKAASMAQMGGSLGGMCLPWIVGLILVRVNPAAGMACIAAGTILMLLIYLGARRVRTGLAALDTPTEAVSES